MPHLPTPQHTQTRTSTHIKTYPYDEHKHTPSQLRDAHKHTQIRHEPSNTVTRSPTPLTPTHRGRRGCGRQPHVQPAPPSGGGGGGGGFQHTLPQHTKTQTHHHTHTPARTPPNPLTPSHTHTQRETERRTAAPCPACPGPRLQLAHQVEKEEEGFREWA